MRPVNRLEPALPAAAMKTYGIEAPSSTHFRAASCAEVNCSAYLNGWRTVVDTGSELGQRQADYIRRESGRLFTVEETEPDQLTFVFEAGQKCFRQHRKRLDREPLYVVRDGDHRGNPRGTSAQRHSGPDAWLDDFANHQQQLADRLKGQ